MGEGAPAGRRWLGLDAFRGLTVAGMLLVNNPGSRRAIYSPLDHAFWHGWTPTDLIFPAFLFIVGITTHIALAARRERGADERVVHRQILRRGAILFLLGLFLAAFPFYSPDDGFAGLLHLRIPGVLQRIAVAYVVAALLARRASDRQLVTTVAVLALGYWALLTLVPVPGHGLGYRVLDDPDAVLPAIVDRLLLDGHLWRVTRTWDPEGILSTFPAIATALLGVLAGRWLGSPRPMSERVAALACTGALAALAGLAWGGLFPINKNLWTSSFVVFTAGVASVGLAICLWLVDAGLTAWARPFVIFGKNPIVAYVGSELVADVLTMLGVRARAYETLVAAGLAPRDASLGYAIAFVLLWLGVLALLDWRKVIIKV